MPSPRRFPAPWSAELQPNYYVVRDANRQTLGYFYFEEKLELRSVTEPEARFKNLRADHALSFCERFFTGDVVTNCIGSASPRHDAGDLLDCLRRHFTNLPLSSRHGSWRRLNMPATYGRLLLRAGTGCRSGI